MAPLQELGFEDFEGTRLVLWLFCDVSNSKQLQEAMIAGDFPVETAMFNAALVPSIFALHVAAHKALIAESLRRFGVNESCRHLLFAALDAAPDAEQLLSKLVDGTLVDDPAKLGELVDKNKLKKYYKHSDAEARLGSLEAIILTQMAARDAA
ncbi:hypothetical protein QBZ16_003389 [Prototheca wickerhamii]|uniref:Uncharacterized protein n=1 Tax=Prototheca wickerhamii TaxID=3111 RepID=A0AAD9IJX6_PROWI|nr:hypothetical protein QBZ16_003389 [Prototheca wickerhamii]